MHPSTIFEIANAYSSSVADVPLVHIRNLWFSYLESYKLPFTIEEVSGQPYEHTYQMDADIQLKSVLKVSHDHCEHPFLSQSQNIKARAIHDYVHVRHKLGFDFDDEVRAFIAEAQELPEAYLPIMPILFSEIVMQAAAFTHYGEFLPQKIVWNEELMFSVIGKFVLLT
jgi:hypothetical protein